MNVNIRLSRISTVVGGGNDKADDEVLVQVSQQKDTNSMEKGATVSMQEVGCNDHWYFHGMLAFLFLWGLFFIKMNSLQPVLDKS